MQLATSHDVKSMLLHMAQRWTELADRLEANISRASPSALEERGLADPAPEAG
jgi:hypothetical protein